jgi:lysophospholipase L1-like esterase
VIDFDALMRDPRRPARLKADLQAGDWLHPNDAGYKTMGDAIDLRLFDIRR